MTGALCSLILTIILIAYAYLKIDVLIEKKDVDIMRTVNDYHFADDEVFGYEEGMNVAVALTAWDYNEDYLLDSTYGELVFYKYSWGDRSDGERFIAKQ